MTNWQKRFAQKLDSVRSATRNRFEQTAETILDPTYKEFADFTTRLHVRATAPLHNAGIRTYKFTMTENSYVLITFRHAGLQCEFQAELFVPGQGKVPAEAEVIDLCDCNREWCQKMFEQTLDRFLDTFTETMGDLVGELIESGAN